jgi:hypothetical protein
MRSSPLLVFTAVLLASAASALGCGSGNSSSNPPQTATGAPPPPGYGYPPGSPGYGQPPPPGYGQPPAPGYPPPAQPGYPPQPQPGYPPQPAPGGAPGPAPAPPPAPAPGPIPGANDALGLAISALAPQQAPGMSPDGARFDTQLQEGGRASTTVSMVAGKCYTVIAVGAAPLVQQLELHLMMPPFNTPAGDDVSSTPSSVIGRGSAALCPLSPIPIPYRLDVVARKGSGPVSVQLYSKAK